MSSKDQILWIDDDESRRRQSENLKEETGMNVIFISLRNKNVQTELVDIRKRYIPLVSFNN